MVIGLPFSSASYLGPVSRKSSKLFGPEKPFAKMPVACFDKFFKRPFTTKKSKIIVKFDDLNCLRSLSYSGNCDIRKRPEKFRDFGTRN